MKCAISWQVLAKPLRIDISPDDKSGSKTVKSEKIHCESNGVKISGVVGRIGSRDAGTAGIADVGARAVGSAETAVVMIAGFFFFRVIDGGIKSVEGVYAFVISSRRSLSHISKCSSNEIIVY